MMEDSLPDVAIIDYQLSNLYSVGAACRKVGLKAIITSNPDIVVTSKAAILPGVGAFGEAMDQMSNLGLDECVKTFIESGKPFVGICLGMQLLLSESEEFGRHKGLNIIPGRVRKFDFTRTKDAKYPVPQIGWNTIKKGFVPWEGTLLSDNSDEDFMYFVHSYYVVPNDPRYILTTTRYGNREYCSALSRGNIFASQFHPEKSGETGLKVYRRLKDELNKRGSI
jgi:glutamine amidotransferase